MSNPEPTLTRSFELKFSWANDHFKKINNVFKLWSNESANTLSEEPDPDCPGGYCTWIDPPPFPADEVSLLVGDCLQCYRSALDHLAFELASAFTIPLTDDFSKASEFPIFGDRAGSGSTDFNRRRSKGSRAGDPAPGSGLAKIAGIDPNAQTIIEGLQPYMRGQSFEDNPLWWLQELNRLDKHRLLHLLAASAGAVTIDFAHMKNVAALTGPSSVVNIPGPVDGRTKVNRWLVTPTPIDPNKEMYMHFPPSLCILFDPLTPVVGGKDVLLTLTAIHHHMVAAVFAPLQPFLK